MERRITKSNGLKGTVSVPGDKSISHRALMIASLAKGKSEIAGFLDAADPASTRTCLSALGVAFVRNGPLLSVHGRGLRGLRNPNAVLDAGNSGTTIRLLSGILSGQPFATTITGDGSLRMRPMKRIMDPLTQMGAHFTSTPEGTAPMTILGAYPLQPIDYRMPILSAQVKSAILLAGLFASGTTRVMERTATRDHTERMLRLKTTRSAEGYAIEVEGGREIEPAQFQVPGDISSAAFLISAALVVPNSELRIRGVGLNPTRARILDFYRSMGASITVLEETIVAGEPIGDLLVKSTELQGNVWLDANAAAELIDEIPIIAVTLALSGAGLTVQGAADLRAKESDRIVAIVTNLRNLGMDVEEYPDGFAFQSKKSLIHARCNSFGDHRIAMAFGVAGLVLPGETIIENAECVDISFPAFWDLLDNIHAH
jgi:3-phosphoshikimate 1-carboxyvinyltransferase